MSIRFIFLSVLLLSIVSGLVWRVVTLQTVDKQFLRVQGDARVIRTVPVQAYRGMILDRQGEPLAISTPVGSVWLNPKEFDAGHPNLLPLAGVLDISLAQLLDKVERYAGREFVYLQRHVTPHIAQRIQQFEIPGVHITPEYRRYYPTGEVTAHVIGFTDIDDHGREGAELAFDTWLRGTAGRKRIVQDRLGREVQLLDGHQAMRSGQDVTLSVDQRLQYLAYRELKAAVQTYQAKAGAAVVLDVETGEILAMVNQPSFNPNMRAKTTSDGRYRNRAVTDVFEPGSVMKTFSVVNALQNSRVTPDTMVDTSPGLLMVGGHLVREIKNKNYGVLNIAAILQKSSNVGVSKLTLELPPERLWKTYTQMGFGTTTGSGFPGESAGTLTRVPKPGSFVLATMSFGYGMNTTLLQLTQAYAVLGAGGVKRPVSFLKVREAPPGEQIISPTVAKQVVDMLGSVVEQGSGTKAKVVGYRIAGKTGTARKSGVGGYQEKNHVAVFVGLAPVTHPKFAIAVMLDDPQGQLYYGSEVAAPVFSRIATGALRLLNVPPDSLEAYNMRIARFTGMTHE